MLRDSRYAFLSAIAHAVGLSRIRLEPKRCQFFNRRLFRSVPLLAARSPDFGCAQRNFIYSALGVMHGLVASICSVLFARSEFGLRKIGETMIAWGGSARQSVSIAWQICRNLNLVCSTGHRRPTEMDCLTDTDGEVCCVCADTEAASSDRQCETVQPVNGLSGVHAVARCVIFHKLVVLFEASSAIVTSRADRAIKPLRRTRGRTVGELDCLATHARWERAQHCPWAGFQVWTGFNNSPVRGGGNLEFDGPIGFGANTCRQAVVLDRRGRRVRG